MKTRNSKFSFIALFCILLISSSCNDININCYQASGSTTQESRDLDGFDGVFIDLGGNVYITQGEQFDVVVSAREDAIDRIQTSISGGDLIIESRRCITNGSIDVYVTMPEIERVTNSGAGNIIGENQWTGREIEFKISGSGFIDADLEYDEVYARISGSGDIELVGNTIDQEIKISGSGKYENFGLFCDNAIVNISGSGRCEVFVDEFLDVSISGSGKVYYRGNASVSSSVSGSGKVINDN